MKYSIKDEVFVEGFGNGRILSTIPGDEPRYWVKFNVGLEVINEEDIVVKEETDSKSYVLPLIDKSTKEETGSFVTIYIKDGLPILAEMFVKEETYEYLKMTDGSETESILQIGEVLGQDMTGSDVRVGDIIFIPSPEEEEDGYYGFEMVALLKEDVHNCIKIKRCPEESYGKYSVEKITKTKGE